MARTRRRFLAAVGASATLAGCVVGAPRGDPRYRLSVRVVGEPDDPFRFDAAVRRAAATNWSPLALRVTYENARPADDERESVAPRSPVRFGEPPADVALLDPDAAYEQAEPGCWTPEADGVGALLGELDLSDLPPGTTAHFDYELWGTPRDEHVDRCLRPGAHRIPMRFGLGAELEAVVEAP
ncbi:hypothetical protein [Halobacterium yunchengense]|uniref:hypothetical protein n=1 Tax=Halobacterium yunchengense TaxID=3108497 RepID=UPI00300B018B